MMHASSVPAEKRRRNISRSSTGRDPTVKDVNSGAVGPWESLQEDLIRLAASRLLAGDLLDYVRFRAVCKYWRSATVSPCGRGVVDPCFHPRRWMMFPEGRDLYPGHPELGDYVRFFNLDSGTFIRVHLPLFKNHCILESVHGLLLLQRDEDTAIRLLHPFTGDIVEFPPLTTLAKQIPDTPLSFHHLRYLCASVSFVAGAVTVLVTFHRFLDAAVATSLDKQWTMLSWEVPVPYIYGPISLQGKIYLVRVDNRTYRGAPKIFEMDARIHQDPPKVIFTCPTTGSLYLSYLVEQGSEILVVSHDCPNLSRMTVYRLADLIMGKFIPVRNIGENAIFIGPRNLCVSSKAFPTVVANTIVCYRFKEYCFAQYNIGTNTWSETLDKCSLNGIDVEAGTPSFLKKRNGIGKSSLPPEGPCSLICHILTCCSPEHWNKGQMYPPYMCRQEVSPWKVDWKVKKQFREGS